MFGEKALELVGELKRARPATIPPYNEDLTRQVREHSPPTRACSSSITHRNTIRIFYNSKTKCKNGQPKIVNSKNTTIIILHNNNYALLSLTSR